MKYACMRINLELLGGTLPFCYNQDHTAHTVINSTSVRCHLILLLSAHDGQLVDTVYSVLTEYEELVLKVSITVANLLIRQQKDK